MEWFFKDLKRSLFECVSSVWCDPLLVKNHPVVCYCGQHHYRHACRHHPADQIRHQSHHHTNPQYPKTVDSNHAHSFPIKPMKRHRLDLRAALVPQGSLRHGHRGFLQICSEETPKQVATDHRFHLCIMYLDLVDIGYRQSMDDLAIDPSSSSIHPIAKSKVLHSEIPPPLVPHSIE